MPDTRVWWTDGKPRTTHPNVRIVIALSATEKLPPVPRGPFIAMLSPRKNGKQQDQNGNVMRHNVWRMERPLLLQLLLQVPLQWHWGECVTVRMPVLQSWCTWNIRLHKVVIMEALMDTVVFINYTTPNLHVWIANDWHPNHYEVNLGEIFLGPLTKMNLRAWRIQPLHRKQLLSFQPNAQPWKIPSGNTWKQEVAMQTVRMWMKERNNIYLNRTRIGCGTPSKNAVNANVVQL